MSPPDIRIEIASVDSFIIRLGLGTVIDPELIPWVRAVVAQLRKRLGARLIEIVPSYTTVMVQYDLLRDDADTMRHDLTVALRDLEPASIHPGRLHDIPVWYAAEVGPDLKALAESASLSVEQLIDRHAHREYSVFAIGFAPCFAYLGLVDPCLAAFRHTRPRRHVPAGSVGIAERQTAIYPIESPGGWHIIGRAPLPLFHGGRIATCPFEVGDRVRFIPIDEQAYLAMGGRMDDIPWDDAS